MRSQLASPASALALLFVLSPSACGGPGDSAPVASSSREVRNDPKHVFLPAPPFDFAACGTTVHAEFPVDNEYAKVTTLPDGTVVQQISGSFKAELTNKLTGQQIDVNASGPGTLTLYTNGDALFEGRGRSLIFFTPQAATANGLPELFLSSGPIDIFFPAGGVAQVQHKNGNVRDLCAELS